MVSRPVLGIALTSAAATLLSSASIARAEHGGGPFVTDPRCGKEIVASPGSVILPDFPQTVTNGTAEDVTVVSILRPNPFRPDPDPDDAVEGQFFQNIGTLHPGDMTAGSGFIFLPTTAPLTTDVLTFDFLAGDAELSSFPEHYEDKTIHVDRCEIELTTIPDACDGIDNDGDGLVDEEQRSCLIRILFVPLAWSGDQASFENAAKAQLAVFREHTGLAACADYVQFEFLSVATQNLPPVTCTYDCGANELLSLLLALNPAPKLADVDVVAAFTDQNLCGLVAGCSDRRALLWAEDGDPATLAHEIGHILGLADEYCSQDAGSTCDRCNRGSPPPPNFLGADLGCDPAQGAGCCTNCSGTVGMCQDDYYVCCDGNLNPAGGRCIMSYAYAPGPDGFDNRCFRHFTHPPNERTPLQPDGQVPMRCDYPYQGHQQMLDLSYTIDQDGRIRVTHATVGRGRLGLGAPGTRGSHAVEVRDGDGNLVQRDDFDLTFGYTCPRFDGVDYSDVRFSRVSRGLRAPLPSDFPMEEPFKVVALENDEVISESCLMVSDATIGSGEGSHHVVAEDVEPPAVGCPTEASVECLSTAGVSAQDPRLAGFFAGASAEDNCDAHPDLHNDAPETFGLGSTDVTFAAKDVDGNVGTCTAAVSVTDGEAPAVSCNALATLSPDTKGVTFRATADDRCDASPMVEVTGTDCFQVKQNGKRIDKRSSCKLSVDHDTITIGSPGGVGTTIEWTVVATDGSGNSSEVVCAIEVVTHPTQSL
jgi:hypothetical protein